GNFGCILLYFFLCKLETENQCNNCNNQCNGWNYHKSDTYGIFQPFRSLCRINIRTEISHSETCGNNNSSGHNRNFQRYILKSADPSCSIFSSLPFTVYNRISIKCRCTGICNTISKHCHTHKNDYQCDIIIKQIRNDQKDRLYSHNTD